MDDFHPVGPKDVAIGKEGAMIKIKELVRKTRSCRRFREEPIPRGLLRDLVDMARLSASGANLQPLKYLLSCDRETNEMIFPGLKWAGYLKEWDGPAEGERPSAYIIVSFDGTTSRMT